MKHTSAVIPLLALCLLTSCGDAKKIDVKSPDTASGTPLSTSNNLINTNTADLSTPTLENPSNNNTEGKTTPVQDSFTLLSTDEKISIQGKDVGGGSPMEGKKIYTGTYEVKLGNASLNLGKMSFSEGTTQDRKVDTVHLKDGTTIGAVYTYYSGNFSAATLFAALPGSNRIQFLQVQYPGYDTIRLNNGALTSRPIEQEGNNLITYSYDNSVAVLSKVYWKLDPTNLIIKQEKFSTKSHDAADDSYLDGGLLDEAAPTKLTEKAVYNFYKALRVADAESAMAYVISEKRGKTPYNVEEMKRIYGSFAHPLRLTSLEERSSTSVEVQYEYTKGYAKNICKDTATVTLKEEMGEMRIAKIIPQKGC